MTCPECGEYHNDCYRQEAERLDRELKEAQESLAYLRGLTVYEAVEKAIERQKAAESDRDHWKAEIEKRDEALKVADNALLAIGIDAIQCTEATKQWFITEWAMGKVKEAGARISEIMGETRRITKGIDNVQV